MQACLNIVDSLKRIRLFASEQFLGLTRGSKIDLGLLPIHKQLFKIFLRNAVLNM